MGILDAGIESIMSSLIPIANDFHEILHAGVFFLLTKQFQKKQADRIIGKAHERILMGDDGSYKRKIDHGGNKAGEPTDDPAIRMDSDISLLVGIFG